MTNLNLAAATQQNTQPQTGAAHNWGTAQTLPSQNVPPSVPYNASFSYRPSHATLVPSLVKLSTSTVNVTPAVPAATKPVYGPGGPQLTGIDLTSATQAAQPPSTPQGQAAVQAPAATPAKAAKKSQRSRSASQDEDPRSVELQYAEHLMSNPRYSKSNAIMHCWDRSCHQPLDADQCEKDAIDWLRQRHPEHTNQQRAKSCLATAILMLPTTPARPKDRTIVACRDVYPRCSRRWQHRAHPPDPSLGMTSCLNIQLCSAATHCVAYAPTPVPPNSLFGHFLKTSLPDLAVRDYLQELMGNTLRPNVDLQKAMLLKGGGRNGKSVITALISALHAKTVSMNLGAMRGFGLMGLIGASLAVVPGNALQGV
ncbi:MAG: hypothetical protein IPJ18_20230 [Betaproteobacteria bacterium]|nr:hypothetical protein [Betaproteobacteria bacterium]